MAEATTASGEKPAAVLNFPQISRIESRSVRVL